MLKKILLISAAVFLLFQSVKLVSVIIPQQIDLWWINLLLAGAINLFVTGIFAFLGFALPTQNLIGNGYYKVKNGKSLKKWYKALNVDLFRKFLLATVWKNKEQHSKFFDGTREGISNLSVQSRKSEFGHLIPLVVIFFICIYAMMLEKWVLVVFTMIINILFNFYPIMLQRYHRLRIQILIARYGDK